MPLDTEGEVSLAGGPDDGTTKTETETETELIEVRWLSRRACDGERLRIVGKLGGENHHTSWKKRRIRGGNRVDSQQHTQDREIENV